MAINYTEVARLAYLTWLASEDAAEESWVRTLRDYAGGAHPIYLTERQQQFIGLKGKDAAHLYAHNLCSLVIATVVERLGVTGFAPKGVKRGEKVESPLIAAVDEWWEANRMDAAEDELYEAALRDGEAYIIVDWQDGQPYWAVNYRFDGTQGVKLHEDPSTGRAVFASKRWQTYDPLEPKNSGLTRMTLYFPDRVEKYIQRREGDPIDNKVDGELMRLNWRTWRDRDDEPWPLPWVDSGGEPLGLAVIAFRNPGGSEIGDVVALQDALNKSDLDLVAAQDAAGFRILYVSGVEADFDKDGNEKVLTVEPSRLVRLTDAQARLGAIDPADLTRMIATCTYWIESIGAQSRTPHYLLHAQTGDQPSGESLKQQETGLVDKSRRKQKIFGNAWEDVLYLSRKLHDLYGDGELPEERIQTQWRSVRSRDEREVWDVAQAKQAAGVDQETTWIEAGYDADQVQLIKDRKEAERQAQGNLGELLLRGFEQGQM